MGSRSLPPEAPATNAANPSNSGRQRLALVTTPGSIRSGIGDYTRHLLPYLERHWQVELFVADELAGREPDERLLRPARELAPRDFEQILYQLGNERAHAFMVPMISKLGGTVAQHDWVLFDLATAHRPALARGGLRGHVEALREGGWAALGAYAASRRAHPHDLSADRFGLPFNRSIVRMADGFVVHNDWLKRQILDERNAWTPVGVLPHGAERRWREGARREGRVGLGLSEEQRDAFLLVSFGAVQEHKRVEVLLQAFARLRESLADARLVFVGAEACERLDFGAHVRELGLEAAVSCTGWVEEPVADAWLHAADLAVNLRGPSTGGASGGLYRALSLGRAVVVSDDEASRELPDGCLRRIAAGEGEVQQLARTLIELGKDESARAAMEREARRYVDEECHWSHVAQRYSELLEVFPAHRSNRKSLIGAAVAAADARRK